MAQHQLGRLAGARVLIVDDDRDVLQSFNVALQAEGARTITAADGNAAVALCIEKQPDLVVLDMMLPGRSGFFALEEIKGRDDSPYVVMCTANEGKRHQQYAEQMGVDGYLIKPVPIGHLISLIAELLADIMKERIESGELDEDLEDADDDDIDDDGDDDQDEDE
ncbi:MAG: response regulator [Planctomycetota bacterium]